MTSWAAVSHFEIFEVIQKFDIYQENGKLKSRSHPIWSEICSKWKLDSGTHRMNPINLYFYIYQDRNAILTSYNKCRSIIKSKIEVEETCADDKSSVTNDDNDIIEDKNDADFTLHPQPDDHPCKDKILIFTIHFSAQVWASIKPIEKIDKNKKPYLTLQDNWTHEISELISTSKKLPCAFSFRSNKVYRLDNNKNEEKSEINDDLYRIKIDGFCAEKRCRAAIYGECNYNIHDNTADMSIFTLNAKEIAHYKKRYVSKGRRAEVKTELKNKKSAQYREELILKFQEYGDQVSPLIPSTKVLNEVKQEAENEDFGIQGDLWENLKRLKYTAEFSSTLRQIGFDRFFVFYWSIEQITVYNDILKLNPVVSIDATGSLVRKIKHTGRLLNGPIFLYQIVTHLDNLIVPVCQMLSERHDTIIISTWLREWIASGADIPQDIVTDMSKSLQNAICLATKNQTYVEYLENCYQYLIDKCKSVSKPYLRIDIAHLIHWMSSLKCFKNATPGIKDFYLRVIGLMSTIDRFDDLKKLMTAIFKICQNSNGCKDDIKWVFSKLETFKFDKSIDYKSMRETTFCDRKNDCDEHLTCNDDYQEETTDQELGTFIDNLAKEASVIIDIKSDLEVSFDDINPYYFPEILGELISLFKKFPAWTNVMRELFGSEIKVATSARSENYFRIIKEDFLNNHRASSIIKILIKHMRSFKARMIEARSEFDKKQSLVKFDMKNHARSKINKDILNACENWKNKLNLNENINVSCEEDGIYSVPDSISPPLISICDSTAPLSNPSTDLRPETQHADILDSPPFFSTSNNNSSNSKPDSFNLPSNNEINASYENTYPLHQSTPEKKPENNLISSASNVISITQSTNDSFSIVLNCPKKFHSKTEKISIKQNVKDSVAIIDNEKSEHLTSFPERQTHKKITDHKQPTKRKIVHSEMKVDKKRGKYVTPCSDIQVLHDNLALNSKKGSKITKKKNIIQNGGGRKPLTINKKKYLLCNTCGFDSLCEIFAFGYANFKNLKKFIDLESKAKCFFTCVTDYATSGALASFYHERINLLYSLYPAKDGEIDGADDINLLIQRLWTKFTYNSSIVEFICTNQSCNKKAIRQLPVLSISAKKVWESGIVKLQDSITDAITAQSLYCKSCTQYSIKKSTSTNVFLCLDISHFYQSSASLSKIYKNRRLTENLGSIPTKVKVLDKNYLLFGVVEFMSPPFGRKIGHYVAYTRSINNNWVERNDLDVRPNHCNSKTTDINISLLFYVLV